MGKRLKFQEMVNFVRRNLKKAPDYRTGQNTQYEIADAGLGAFSVFYMQAPSFLAHQRDMRIPVAMAACLRGYSFWARWLASQPAMAILRVAPQR